MAFFGRIIPRSLGFSPHFLPSKAVAGRCSPSLYFLFWSYFGRCGRILFVFSRYLMPFLERFSRLFSICLQIVIAIHTFRMV